MRKILCVVGHMGERLQVEAAFARAGHAPVVCGSLSEARQCIPLHTFEVVVADETLPDGSALDLLPALRSARGGAEPPLLVLGERIEVADCLACLDHGAADYLGKPCDDGHLVDRALAALSQRRGLARPLPRSATRSVLLVDDSATYAYALNDELRKDGHDVAIAQSGEAALQLLAAREPDLVILDVFLPDWNGVDLCARVRQTPAHAHLRLLMLTGRDRTSVRERALQSGANDFVVKSRDLESVRLCVRKMLASEEQAQPSSRRKPLPSPVPPSAVTLLDLVANASGLSRLVGRSTIERACRNIGADPACLTPRELERALPDIERVLRVYLPAEVVTARMASISLLAGSRLAGSRLAGS